MKDNQLKIVVIALIMVILVVLATTGIVLTVTKEEEKVLKEKNYTVYVKINPLVKLDFKESYYECTDPKGNINKCSDTATKVTSASLLNEDAKTVYSNLNVDEKDLVDALTLLITTANKNNISVEEVQLTTNWNNSIMLNSIKKEVNKKTNLETTFKTTYKLNLNEKEILAAEAPKNYLVTFNSNGGSSVDSKIVKEKNKVDKPQDPTKDGYQFVEWQLNGKTYDFNLEVTKNIVLTALWKQTETNFSPAVTTPTTQAPSCTAKKFAHQYSYVYETNDECVSKGNNAFNEVSDTIDSEIFSYGCEAIVDDCGTTWYGVYFNHWKDGQTVKVYH